MIRGKEDGIYRLRKRVDYIPAVPEISTDTIATIEAKIGIKTADIHRPSENRASLINYFGRDIAIRHINNWMGDHVGYITSAGASCRPRPMLHMVKQ